MGETGAVGGKGDLSVGFEYVVSAMVQDGAFQGRNAPYGDGHSMGWLLNGMASAAAGSR